MVGAASSALHATKHHVNSGVLSESLKAERGDGVAGGVRTASRG